MVEGLEDDFDVVEVVEDESDGIDVVQDEVVVVEQICKMKCQMQGEK